MNLKFSEKVGNSKTGLQLMTVLMHKESLDFCAITGIESSYLILYNFDTELETLIRFEQLADYKLGGAC